MGEGGPVFQMGDFIFKWEVCLIGDITFDGGLGLKKIVGWGGGHPLRPTPLWQTLYMENVKQIMDDSKQ